VITPSEFTAIQSVARKLGIGSPETLRKWIRRAEIDAGSRPGLTTQESEQIKVLKKENAELRRANEILKSTWQQSRPPLRQPTTFQVEVAAPAPRLQLSLEPFEVGRRVDVVRGSETVARYLGNQLGMRPHKGARPLIARCERPNSRPRPTVEQHRMPSASGIGGDRDDRARAVSPDYPRNRGRLDAGLINQHDDDGPDIGVTLELRQTPAQTRRDSLAPSEVPGRPHSLDRR